MERNEAIDKGLHVYNTGRPCKYGHASIRYTKSGICVQCAKNNTSQYVKRRAQRIAMISTGLVQVDRWVHRDDLPSILAAIDMMNTLRGVVQPQARVTADVDVNDPDSLYALHVRLHGKETADRIRATAPPPGAPIPLHPPAPIVPTRSVFKMPSLEDIKR